MQNKNYFALKCLALLLIWQSFSCCLADAQNSNFRVGTNVGRSGPGNPDAMFVDLFEIGWWQQTTTGPLNATGYPTKIISADGAAQIWFPTGGTLNGTYQFYGDGSFDITGGWGFASLVPSSVVKTGNITRASITINHPPTPQFYPTPQSNDPQYSAIYIKNIDSNNPPQNFHLIRPDFQAWPNTNARFGPEFLKALSIYDTARMMDFLGTNGSDVVSWGSNSTDYFGQNFYSYDDGRHL